MADSAPPVPQDHHTLLRNIQHDVQSHTQLPIMIRGTFTNSEQREQSESSFREGVCPMRVLTADRTGGALVTILHIRTDPMTDE
jgi:hypothetical protein